MMSIILKVKVRGGFIEKEADAITCSRAPGDFCIRYKAREVGTGEWFFFRKGDNKGKNLPQPRDVSAAHNRVWLVPSESK